MLNKTASKHLFCKLNSRIPILKVNILLKLQVFTIVDSYSTFCFCIYNVFSLNAKRRLLYCNRLKHRKLCEMLMTKCILLLGLTVLSCQVTVIFSFCSGIFTESGSCSEYRRSISITRSLFKSSNSTLANDA